MNKIITIGDLHGDYRPIKKLNTIKAINNNDIIICLGDFGGNFFFDYRDRNFKEKLGKYNITYFIIRGNHEQRPGACADGSPHEWHIETFWNNKVYVENKYPYIKYALDAPAKYEIPIAQGKNLQTLVLPGAYSVDKYYRLANNWTWFEQEQLTEEEMAAGTALAQSQSWDLVLSHTCPICYEPTDLFIPDVDQSLVDKTMERWLGSIEYTLDYKLWCWGHFHHNRVYPHFNNSDRLMLAWDCYCDLNKYFSEKYKLIDCLVETTDNTQICNLNVPFDKIFKDN